MSRRLDRSSDKNETYKMMTDAMMHQLEYIYDFNQVSTLKTDGTFNSSVKRIFKNAPFIE